MNGPFPPKNCAIVGNGGSLLESDLGGTIDAFDKVVRFNNFRILPHCKDVGSKVHYWVTTFGWGIEPRGLGFESILCPYPVLELDWWDLNWGLVRPLRKMIDFIPKNLWMDLYQGHFQALEIQPSAGLSFLFWFYRIHGSIDPKCLFGFDFFDKNKPHHYFDIDNTCSHNGDLERELVRKMQTGELK